MMNVICTPSGVRAWKNASSFLLALLEIHKVPYLSVRIPKVGTYLCLVTHGQQDYTPANVNTLHVHARIQYFTNPVNFNFRDSSSTLAIHVQHRYCNDSNVTDIISNVIAYIN